MDNINWIHILIALISGGAMGAIINQVFYWRRNRIQSVGKNIEVKPFFIPTKDGKSLNTKITIDDGNNQKYEFENLWIATLLIANKGNKDFNEFNFGIDIKNEATVIRASSTNSNRHHQLIFKDEPELNRGLNELDITLKPLNRNQVYEIDIYITTNASSFSESDIDLISPHPIKFVQIKNFAEILGEVAGGVALGVLGNTVTVRLPK